MAAGSTVEARATVIPDPVVAVAAEDPAYLAQADAPPCPNCGSITVRNGACYKCVNCGTTTGCS
jgi:ribonucleoside-diphosphate reductase alpha chain